MDEETGAASVFRRPSHFANGNTRDAGIRGNYLGNKGTAELPFRVYRIDGQTGALTVAIDDMGGRMALRSRLMRLGFGWSIRLPNRRRRMSTT